MDDITGMIMNQNQEFKEQAQTFEKKLEGIGLELEDKVVDEEQPEMVPMKQEVKDQLFDVPTFEVKQEAYQPPMMLPSPEKTTVTEEQ